MINFRNIKHIFFIIAICLTILFGSYKILFKDFLPKINYFFTYQTGKQTNGENTLQDFIYKHNLAPGKNIVIVEIDEETIDSLGGKSDYSMLTIGKDKYAKLVEIINSYGAKAIGFDIVFQNPDPEHEALFVETMKKYGNVTIGIAEPNVTNAQLGKTNIDICSGNTDDIESLTCPWTPRAIYRDIRWWNIANSNIIKHNLTTQEIDAKYVGYNIMDYPMQNMLKFWWEEKVLRPRDGYIYTLPIAMLLHENNPIVSKLTREVFSESPPKKVQILQPYFSESEASKQEKPYRSYSMKKILENPKEYADQFRDAYVIIWETGTLLHDTILSPVTGNYIPWMYAHAFLLDGILQDKLLSKLNESTVFFLSTIITILSVIIYFYLPKYFAPVFAIFAFLFTIFIARYSYDVWRVVFDIFPFLIGSSLVTFPVTYSYKFFVVDKDKRQILNAFSRYLSPSVVDMIDANQIDVTLGGEKKELSILFSDIAGFTTISEKLNIKDLFSLMTKYLSTMTNILINEKWTLDKYIGDAVMWFFGAPVDDPFHAVNACNTALKMRWALWDFNKMLVSEWKETINFRVGIATWEVLVGNIGSEQQFNYTVLWDTVNLASRLEATGKEYGVSIIIAASTRLAIWDQFLLRELDYIAVKWKNEGVRIYELLGRVGDDIDMTKYTVYESWLRLYREGKYLEAGRIFEKNAPIDPPSDVMMRRCVALIKWEMELENGVYKMTHK